MNSMYVCRLVASSSCVSITLCIPELSIVSDLSRLFLFFVLSLAFCSSFCQYITQGDQRVGLLFNMESRFIAYFNFLLIWETRGCGQADEQEFVQFTKWLDKFPDVQPISKTVTNQQIVFEEKWSQVCFVLSLCALSFIILCFLMNLC